MFSGCGVEGHMKTLLVRIVKTARRWKALSREKDWQQLEIFAGSLECKAMATPELGWAPSTRSWAAGRLRCCAHAAVPGTNRGEMPPKVQVQALASILKAHIMAMMGILGILTLVVMEVVVAEDKPEVTTGPAAKVVAAELALALARRVHTGNQIMQMLMPMVMVKEKAPVKMVVVVVVKVVVLATVMQTLRSSTIEKMEPNQEFSFKYCCIESIKGSMIVQAK